jgi:uncharacterized protein
MRDRDAAGRARNARPRDGLGRPLDRGSPGEPTMPDEAALGPQDALETAQRLLDTGRPFHAHEVLEASWKAAPAAERELWQGLAQLAVGLTHALRGNPAGAVTLLRRGADRISRYGLVGPCGPAAPAGPAGLAGPTGLVGPYGINVAGLAASATGLADRISRGGLAGLTPGELTLQLTGDRADR